MLEQDRFPRARPPDNRHRFAPGDIDTDSVQHDLRAEPPVDIFDLKQHFTHGYNRNNRTAKKKLNIRMSTVEITTERVVACPTPWAPPPVLKPS